MRIKEVAIVDPKTLGEAPTVASFRRYGDAQEAVDRLARLRLPAGTIAIAARQLRVVEREAGRGDALPVAARSAATGAAAGALLGLVLGLTGVGESAAAGLVAAVWGAFLGAVVGAAVALVHQLRSGDAPDEGSELSLQAGRFDLVAAAPVAEEVARVLRADEGAHRPASGAVTVARANGS